MIGLQTYHWRNLNRVAVPLGEGIYLFLCLGPLWLGIDLLLPGSTFAASPAWRIAAASAPEEVWGARYLFVSFLGLSAFFVPKGTWRMICTGCLASANGATAIMLVCGAPLNTGTGIYLLISMLGYGLLILMAWDDTR